MYFVGVSVSDIATSVGLQLTAVFVCVKAIRYHDSIVILEHEQFELEQVKILASRYRALFTDAPISFFSIDSTNHTIRTFNKMASRLSNLPLLEGLQFHKLFQSEDQQVVEETLIKCVQSKQNQTIRARLDNGKNTETFVDLSVSAGVQETVLHVILKDVTLSVLAEKQSKQLNQELRKAKEVAENLSDLKSNFLATMSHELRTPLNGISISSEILKDLNMNEEQSNYVTIIHKSSKLLLKLISQILDFSKFESIGVILEEKPFKLMKCIQDIVDSMTVRVSDRELKIITDFRDIPAVAVGDSTRLSQVLLNLLSNAYKFSPDGGKVTLEAKCTLSTPQSVHLDFKVSDEGSGIPEGLSHLLFKRFSQLDSSNSRKYGGTGLGLAISMKIVEAMHGKIGVTNIPTGGSCFWFSCVFRAAEPQQEPSQYAYLRRKSITEEIIGTDNIMSSKYENSIATLCTSNENESDFKILIAEDNAVNRLCLTRLLNKLGYHNVAVACDGKQAVEEFKSSRPKLVLMDVSMPVLDGLAATKLIRTYETEVGLAPTPIIAVTANVYGAQKCIEVGMDSYITKPITTTLLSSTLGEYLEVK
jgi:signal transduction histidine kinase